MKLSFCVVNYYTEVDLMKFLGSISDFRPDCIFEVIIVNNGSKQKYLQSFLREKYGNWIHVMNTPSNLGFGAAQNKAVKKAKGEYVFLCNPDLEIEEGSIKHLLDFAEGKEALGLVGPQLLSKNGDLQESCRRFPSFLDLVSRRLHFIQFFNCRMKSYLMHDRNMNKPQKVDWLVGAAMLIKRNLFLDIGGFDERFFLFFEDIDLCRRLQQAGREIWYYPYSVCIHSQKRLSERGLWPFRRVFWIHVASAVKYFAKWGR